MIDSETEQNWLTSTSSASCSSLRLGISIFPFQTLSLSVTVPVKMLGIFNVKLQETAYYENQIQINLAQMSHVVIMTQGN